MSTQRLLIAIAFLAVLIVVLRAQEPASLQGFWWGYDSVTSHRLVDVGRAGHLRILREGNSLYMDAQPLADRIAELEERIAEVETRPSAAYVGGPSGAITVDNTTNPPEIDIVRSVLGCLTCANVWKGRNEFQGPVVLPKGEAQ